MPELLRISSEDHKAQYPQEPLQLQIVLKNCALSHNGNRGKVTEAYFRQASADYSGVCDGYYIDFEVKETRQ